MKKLLAVMLAMVMVLSLLAGCGSKSNKKNNKKDDKDDDDDKETTSDVASDASGKEDDKKDDDSTSSTKNKKPAKDDEEEEEEEVVVTAPNEDEEEVTVPNNKPTAPEPTTPEPTTPQQPSGGVSIGTDLDQPEIIFDLSRYDALQLSITMVEEGDSYNFQFAAVNTTNAEITYVIDSEGFEAIYEETTSGVTKYIKSGSAFVLDTSMDSDGVEEELYYFDGLAEQFIACQEVYNGITFRKAGAQNAPTGPVYVYDVVYEGEVDGQIWIDQATGLMVKVTAYSGDFTYNVTQFKLSAVNIPTYK